MVAAASLNATGAELRPLVERPEAWLRQLLFDGRDGLGQTYLVLPSLRRPRFVVPVSHHAARGFRAAGGGGARRHRVRHAGVAAGLRLGAGRWVGERVEGPAAGGLMAVLRGVVPATHALAVRLSTLRPNAKPVAVLLDRRGAICGYAKVGWNTVTRKLVADEARTLSQLDWAPEGTLVAPRLLGLSEWHGFTVAVQEPLPHGSIPRRRLTPELAAHALRDVAGEIAPPRAIGDSEYGEDLRRRAEAIAEADQRAIASRLVDDVLDQHGARVFSMGRWHGDFTRWNTSVVGGRVAVWDWERSRAGVPIGLDALHYHTRLGDLVQDPRRGLRRAVRRARPWLEHLTVPSESVPALQDLHLIELLLRHRTDGDGVATPERTRLVAAIERTLSRSLEV